MTGECTSTPPLRSTLIKARLREIPKCCRTHADAAEPKRALVAAAGLQIGLARIQSNGTLDTSFGVGGYVLTNISGGASGRAVAIASQDSSVVAGETRGALDVQIFDQNGTSQGL